MVQVSTASPISVSTQDRSWSVRQRAAWWAKFLVAVAGGVVAVAAAASALGLSVDVETKTAATAEHTAIRTELRAEQAQAFERVERAIDGLSRRIDDALLVQSRRGRRDGEGR